ncbi:hypothetical protein R83H12_02021 [Fibrobacteria bacterium R8-3-H12]
MSLIENKLKRSDENDCKSSKLCIQWNFDKAKHLQLLEAITINFPHYSLHNGLHSQNIITEIEKILGEKIIENLSYIDCWLLLESAFWHDIGMYVSYNEKIEIMKKQDFKNFIENIKLDKNNDLFNYAEKLDDFIKNNPLNDLKSLIDINGAFIFLFAEYTRKEHGKKSKEVLLNTTKDSQLIDKRLITLLSDIVECHCKPFDEIFKLPLMNDGLDVDDVAHPRFIACLLRLGDLLDLDSDRHNHYVLNIIGEIPSISKAHYNGHCNIVSKNINSDIIEIKCQFKNKNSIFDKSFEIQNKWFELIKNEIENLNKNLDEIVPKDYAWEPPIAKLFCEINGCVTIDKNSPKLKFDDDRIYQYLVSNIYNNRWSFMNEILQNAVDATIDRIWIEKGNEIGNDRKKFKEIACSEKYRIDIDVKTEEYNCENEEPKFLYKIEVKDNGKGMNLEEIKSMLTIASKENQQKKAKYRNGMPEWMKPSGFFGIGLQSVFSRTEQIEIETIAPNDFAYEIVMKKMSSSTSYYAIEKIVERKWNFGTTIRFNFLDKKIPDIIYGTEAVRELSKFDPLKDDTLDGVSVEIRDVVTEFARLCDIQMYFNGKCLNEDINKNNFMIVDIDNGIEYNLVFSLIFLHTSHFWNYRGRRVKDFNFNSILFRTDGNIISGKADDFLSLNRDEFHYEGKQKLADKILSSLCSKKEEILGLKELKNKEITSLYYYLREDYDNGLWKDIELVNSIDGKSIKVKDLVVDKNKINISFDSVYGNYKLDSIECKNNSPYIIKSEESILLLEILKKLKKGIIIHSIEEIIRKIVGVEINMSPLAIYYIEIVDDITKSEMKEPAINFLSSSGLYNNRTRYYLPCGVEEYKNISFDKEVLDKKYKWIAPIDYYINHFYSLFPKIILLPSTAKECKRDDDLELLAEKIHSHKNEQGEDISKSDILKELKDFFEKFKFEVKEVS